MEICSKHVKMYTIQLYKFINTCNQCIKSGSLLTDGFFSLSFKNIFANSKSNSPTMFLYVYMYLYDCVSGNKVLINNSVKRIYAQYSNACC